MRIRFFGAEKKHDSLQRSGDFYPASGFGIPELLIFRTELLGGGYPFHKGFPRIVKFKNISLRFTPTQDASGIRAYV